MVKRQNFKYDVIENENKLSGVQRFEKQNIEIKIIYRNGVSKYWNIDFKNKCYKIERNRT